MGSGPTETALCTRPRHRPRSSLHQWRTWMKGITCTGPAANKTNRPKLITKIIIHTGELWASRTTRRLPHRFSRINRIMGRHNGNHRASSPRIWMCAPSRMRTRATRNRSLRWRSRSNPLGTRRPSFRTTKTPRHSKYKGKLESSPGPSLANLWIWMKGEQWNWRQINWS